jgi:hypothetical protein
MRIKILQRVNFIFKIAVKKLQFRHLKEQLAQKCRLNYPMPQIYPFWPVKYGNMLSNYL